MVEVKPNGNGLLKKKERRGQKTQQCKLLPPQSISKATLLVWELEQT